MKLCRFLQVATLWEAQGCRRPGNRRIRIFESLEQRGPVCLPSDIETERAIFGYCMTVMILTSLMYFSIKETIFGQ